MSLGNGMKKHSAHSRDELGDRGPHYLSLGSWPTGVGFVAGGDDTPPQGPSPFTSEPGMNIDTSHVRITWCSFEIVRTEKLSTSTGSRISSRRSKKYREMDKSAVVNVQEQGETSSCAEDMRLSTVPFLCNFFKRLPSSGIELSTSA